MTVLLGTIAAYLLGGFSTSYLAGKLAGIDLREHGSKNLGATNVYRVLGWRYAIPVGLIDVAKGTVPVAFVAPWASPAPWAPLLLGVAAILGHVYSPFLKFRGGKGVATAAGVVLGLAPLPLAVSTTVWLVVLGVSGYVSLASILGAAAFPFAAWLLTPRDRYAIGAGVAIAGFIVFTHRGNIRRLLAGTESRIGRRRTGPA